MEAAAPITLTVLTDLADVEAVLTGENGLIAGWAAAGVKRPVCIVHGTVSPIGVVDALLSGGVAGAESGALSVMVGGSDDVVGWVWPVLSLVGSTVRHLGPSGAGGTAKACNQVVRIYGSSPDACRARDDGGPTSPTAREQLAEHAALRSVRGVRDILNWHPDPVLTHRDRSDLLTDPTWRSGFAALREFGLSFDLQVFPCHLRQAAALAADHGTSLSRTDLFAGTAQRFYRIPTTVLHDPT